MALGLQMRQIGNLFGVAIASTLIQNAVSHAPISKEILREILDNPPRLRSSHSGFTSDTVNTVLDYYQSGFRKVFLAAALGSAISFVGAVLLIRHHSIEAAGQSKGKRIKFKAPIQQLTLLNYSSDQGENPEGGRSAVIISS